MLGVVQRAAFAGVIQAFYDAFNASSNAKDARKRIDKGRNHEGSLITRKSVCSEVFARSNERAVLSWLVVFKDPTLGRVQFDFSDEELANFVWERETADGYSIFSLVDDEPQMDQDVFLLVIEAFRHELYRYLNRRKIHVSAPAAKLLSPMK